MTGVQDAQEVNQVGFLNWSPTRAFAALPTDLCFVDTSMAKVKQVTQAPKVMKVSSCGPSIVAPADQRCEADYCRQKRN
jgi:hypothetical protein